MRQITEISLDLTTEELLDLPADASLTEIDDICALDSAGDVANTEPKCGAPASEEGANAPAAVSYADGDAVEIELKLTPLEMETLLNGEWKP